MVFGRAGLIRWVTAVPLFVIHKQRRQAEKQKEDGQKPKAFSFQMPLFSCLFLLSKGESRGFKHRFRVDVLFKIRLTWR